jgi:hypothetical protein
MKKTKNAFLNEKLSKELISNINYSYFLLAELLCKNIRKKYYTDLGHESFEAYIAQEDLSIPQLTAGKLIIFYENFILRFGLTFKDMVNIDFRKINLLLQLDVDGKINENNYREWLDKASGNAYSDFKASVMDALISRSDSI